MSDEKSKQSHGQALLGMIGAGVAIWFFWGGGLEKQAAKDMARVENDVAKDAVAQYEIVSRQGSKMDKCVHAGFVMAAFVQAKDEANVKKWKAIEKTDCAKAGVPNL